MICVYKILSPDLQECYVGSTKNYAKRIANHKQSNNTCTSKILFDKYGFDNCPFVILEQCNEDELIDKEQWWMDHSVGLVNKLNAICDTNKRKENNKKWKETNSEKIKESNKKWQKEHRKEYQEANKEKIKEYYKKYYEAKKLKSI